MHFGVSLPNYGASVDLDEVRRTAELAEELGFHSVWATEHIVVAPSAADRYGAVFDPFVTLAWVAGWTSRVELGTSITLVPLHNPFDLAKKVATLSALSGRRVRLGVGAGWHEEEFTMMGVEFAGRGRRMDEALRLVRALWAGETAFAGDVWRFEDAVFAPLPPIAPELWVGGATDASIRRIQLLGDATWHPTSMVDLDYVRRVRAEHPEIPLIPRSAPQQVEAFLELGAQGAVVMFPGGEAEMRAFAATYL